MDIIIVEETIEQCSYIALGIFCHIHCLICVAHSSDAYLTNINFQLEALEKNSFYLVTIPCRMEILYVILLLL